MSRPTTTLAAVTLSLGSVASAGCTSPAAGPGSARDPGSAATSQPSGVSTSSRAAGAPTRNAPAGGPTLRDGEMRVEITVGDDRFGATLEDSAAGRDLVGQLPVTVEMRDHGGVEKTGVLPAPLSLAGQPGGADPAVGDIGYYAPGNDLVLYYGDQSSFAGIVVLGRMDPGAADRLADLAGPVSVEVEAGA